MRTILRSLLVAAPLIGACSHASPRSTTTTTPTPPPTSATPRAPAPAPLSIAEQDALDSGILRLAADDRAVRLDGAARLADLGPLARPALKYLVDCLLRDDDEKVARACADAAVAIGPGAAPMLEQVAASSSPRAHLARRAVAAID